MGNLILLISLVILAIFIFKTNGNNFISCSLIATSMFAIAASAVFVNESYWNQYISMITIITILSALLVLYLGEILAKRTVIVFGNKKNSQMKDRCSSIVNNGGIYTTLLLTLLMIVLFVIYIMYLRRVVVSAGFAGNIVSIMSNIKSASINENTEQMGTLLSQGYQLMRCIGYYYIYMYIYNVLYKSKNKINLFLLPACIFIFSTLLSAGRLGIIRVFVYSLIIWVTLYERCVNRKIQVQGKIVKRVAVVLIVFLLLFRFLTLLRNPDVDIKSYLSVYQGASIVSFDKYLNKNCFISKNPETFRAVASYFQALGINIPPVTYNFDPVYWYSSNGSMLMTNVFTAFRRYIHDFGYIGMYLISFFLGYFYTRKYESVKKDYSNHLGLVFIASIFYPVVNLVFEEQFTNEILSINCLINYVYFYILFKFFTTYVYGNEEK